MLPPLSRMAESSSRSFASCGGDDRLFFLLELRDAEGEQDERGKHKDEDRHEHPRGDADGRPEAREGQGQGDQHVRPAVRILARAPYLSAFIASLEVAHPRSNLPLLTPKNILFTRMPRRTL